MPFLLTAIIVRIRSKAVVNGNQTSRATEIRKVLKSNKPMKKKLEIRFNNGSCNCRTELFVKRDYFVFGDHVPWNGTIAYLEIKRNSFVAEWDESFEKEIEQMEGYCSRSSMVPTPRMIATATPSTGTYLQLMKTLTTIASLSTLSSIPVETPTSRDRTDVSTAEPSATTSAVEECGSCEILVKRTRAYCTSDFVIHAKILSEAITEFSHDTKYRIQLIHTFKLTSAITTLRSVWILDNLCRCPLLLHGKEYLLMGRLGVRAGSNEPIAEISRQSYVEEWRRSMIRRLPGLKKRCPLNVTQMSTLVTTNSASVSATIPSTTGTRMSTEEITSQPPTSLPTSKPPVECRRCRISKKRNKNYCDSDFVIRARILRASFNDTLQERKYRVKIIKVFRSVLDLKEREDIFVLNDYCQCPKLELRGQYVIMGTVEQVSITDVRLLIPPRPFVWIWKSRMEAGFETIRDICDT